MKDTESIELQSFLTEHWQKIFSGILTLSLGIWFYGEYKETINTRMGEASSSYSQAADTLKEIINELRLDPTNTSAIEKKDTTLSNLERIKSEYSGSIYSIISSIKKMAASLEISGLVSKESLPDIYNSSVENEAFNEISSLILIRSELEKNSQISTPESKEVINAELEKLKALVLNSKYLKEEALLSLISYLPSSDLNSFLSVIKKDRPELIEDLNETLVEFGIIIS